MKKILSLFAMLCLAQITVKADTDVPAYDNIIYVASATVDPADGTEIELSICMNNTADIRGFQFDMYLPDGMTAVKTSKEKIVASLNAARLSKDDEHTLTVAEQADGALRFLCGSQYDETFTGTSGKMATIKVNIKGLSNGKYPITLKAVKLSETDISKFYEVSEVVTKLTVSSSTEDTDVTDYNNIIYVAPAIVDPVDGTEIELSICMNNTADIRGFQFDMYLPDGMTAVKTSKGKVAASLNGARLPEDDEHTLTVAEQADDAIRFLCGSQYDETFTGTSGEIATVKVNIKNMADGEYPIILKDIKLSETDISKFYEVSDDVTTLTISTGATQAAADQAAADAVIAKIADIGEVAYTDESKALIDAAREAYDALTDTQKELVTNYNVLTDAEKTYADLKAAADQAAAEQAANQAAAYTVIAKITDIGEVAYTDESKALIDAAREAYDALTDTQKELVTNYNVLTNAEATYADLKAAADQAAAEQAAAEQAAAEQAAADQAAADAVIAKIADIGEVAYTDECKALIDAAREAYDDLTDTQKELVTNDEMLTDAEATYADLKAAADQAAAEQAAAEQAAAEQAAANQAAADAVIAKIADIGEVTYTDESKALIDASRAAYDALTDTQKELVTNYNVLTDAEATYADLKTAADQAAAEQAANQAATNAVIAKIADIGEVAYTDECKALIDAAREAYDALTETQKELVANYNVLTDAEKTYADLEAYTGINDTPVNDTIKEKGWYDMNGHRLAGKPIVKGMYVKDGKKVIITF